MAEHLPTQPRFAGHGPWETNPLLTNIRKEMEFQALSASYESRRNNKSISSLDIMLQTMLVAASYEPDEVWFGVKNGSDELITGIVSNIRNGNVSQARLEMDTAINRGDLWINEVFVSDIMASQTTRLARLADYGEEELQIPYQFRITLWDVTEERRLRWERRVHRVGENHYEASAVTGLPMWLGEYNGRYGPLRPERIEYRSVSPEMSKKIAENWHYVHSARDDEVAAFGAFVPWGQFPFAWVSFSRPGRNYKREMLAYYGADPDYSLELTRAWQADRSPKNSLSMLFSFAHESLRKRYKEEGQQELNAIITAVNPNLGFVGSAFRAVGYRLAANKSTHLEFGEDDGIRHYVTSRQQENLQALEDAKQFIPAKFPLLDTHELIVRFPGSNRRFPDRPIIRYADGMFSVGNVALGNTLRDLHSDR